MTADLAVRGRGARVRVEMNFSPICWQQLQQRAKNTSDLQACNQLIMDDKSLPID